MAKETACVGSSSSLNRQSFSLSLSLSLSLTLSLLTTTLEHVDDDDYLLNQLGENVQRVRMHKQDHNDTEQKTAITDTKHIAEQFLKEMQCKDEMSNFLRDIKSDMEDKRLKIQQSVLWPITCSVGDFNIFAYQNTIHVAHLAGASRKLTTSFVLSMTTPQRLRSRCTSSFRILS